MNQHAGARRIALGLAALHVTVFIVLYLLNVRQPSWRLPSGPSGHPRKILVARTVFDPNIGKFRQAAFQIYDPAKHTPEGAPPVSYEEIQRLYNTTDSPLLPLGDALVLLESRHEVKAESKRRRDPLLDVLRDVAKETGLTEEKVQKVYDSFLADHGRGSVRDFRDPLRGLLAERGWNEEEVNFFLFGSPFKSSDLDLLPPQMRQWIYHPTTLAKPGVLYSIEDDAVCVLDLCRILGGVGFFLWGVAILLRPHLLPEGLAPRHKLVAYVCLAVGAVSEIASLVLAEPLFGSSRLVEPSGEVLYLRSPVSLWDGYVAAHSYAAPGAAAAGILALGLVLALWRKRDNPDP